MLLCSLMNYEQVGFVFRFMAHFGVQVRGALRVVQLVSTVNDILYGSPFQSVFLVNNPTF